MRIAFFDLIKLGFLALIVCLMLMGALNAALPNPTVTPIDAHSTAHDNSAEMLGCNNVISIWLDPKCERFNIIKQLDKQRFCDEVVLPSKRGLLLKTIYEFAAAPSEEAVENILKAKGCVKIAP